MLACHSPNQFKSSAVSGLGFSRITSRTERIAVYIEIVFHHIWDKQEFGIIPSKSFLAAAKPPSGWWVMKTLLMCWCWVWQYESQPELSPAHCKKTDGCHATKYKPI